MKRLLPAALCVAAAAPWLTDGYTLFQLTQLMSYAIAILGLTLLTGLSGQFSLGHGAFFALGAYTVALGGGALTVYGGVALAALNGFVAGVLIALPLIAPMKRSAATTRGAEAAPEGRRRLPQRGRGGRI